MAKKLPLLTLTFTISTLIATVPKPSFAAIQYNNDTWWSVAEMLELYQQVEQEKIELCGDDTNCAQEFYTKIIDRGDKYYALDKFAGKQFWVTSINPKKETIKILFLDQERKMISLGFTGKITPQSFYLAWFDNWQGQIYNFYRPQFISGEIEGLHTVYDSIAEDLDIANFPVREEVEFSVSGSNLIDNSSRRLDYAVSGSDGYSLIGSAKYSDCLNAPDYEDGMECSLRFSSIGRTSFFPPRAEIIESDPTLETDPAIEDNPEPSNQNTDNLDSANDLSGISNLDFPEDSSIKNEDNIGGNADNETLQKRATIIADIPKTPDTGVQTYPSEVCNREINLPWWLIALIFIGNALLLWFFVPNRQKTSKKHKKSLDKKTVMR